MRQEAGGEMPVSRDRDKTRSGPRGGTEALARRLRLIAMILPLAAVAVLLSACTFDGPTMTINYHFSPENRELAGLYLLVWWLGVAVFVVFGTMFLSPV